MKANSIEELFGTLQQSVVEEWRKHLKTSKYSKHMALDEFYKDMPELVDALIEGYNGHVGKKIETFKNVLDAEKLDALQYLEELHDLCQSGYDLLPKDAPELKSDLDAIKSKIDSTMYKVRELKENKIVIMKTLSTFLNESLLSEARQHKCEIQFIEYDRGGGEGYWFQFTAEDRLDMLMKVVDNINLYMNIESFTDPDEDLYVKDDATPDERDNIYSKALDGILEQNGDGCDFIVSLEFDGRSVINEYFDDNSDEGVFPRRPKKVNW